MQKSYFYEADTLGGHSIDICPPPILEQEIVYPIGPVKSRENMIIFTGKGFYFVWFIDCRNRPISRLEIFQSFLSRLYFCLFELLCGHFNSYNCSL